MKYSKYTTYVIITFLTLCIFTQDAFASAPQTTHAGLTQEIIAFYEAKNGDHFSTLHYATIPVVQLLTIIMMESRTAKKGNVGKLVFYIEFCLNAGDETW